MKKLFFILLLVSVQKAFSQTQPEFRVHLYAGYVFDDKVGAHYTDTSYYNGTVKANFKWGVGLEYMILPVIGIELTYLRNDTKAPITYYDNDGIGNPVKSTEFDVNVNYILVGPTLYFPKKPSFEPYFGFHLGVGVINVGNPTNGVENKVTKFGYQFKGGANFWLSEKIALRAQADAASLVQAVGGEIYFSGKGINPALATYVSTLQFSLTGALVIRLGNSER